MSDEGNGFEDMAKILGQMNISENIADDGLEKAANAFADWVRPKIPYDDHSHNKAKYGHMREQFGVVKTSQGYDVTFGDAYWWYFSENGTGGKHPQKAQNYVHGTFSQKWNEIESMLQAAAIKKIEK